MEIPPLKIKTIVSQNFVDEKGDLSENESRQLEKVSTIYKEESMYLISIYFDEKTDAKIQNLTKQIAKHTGNEILLERNVPSHLTLSAFHAYKEETALEIFRNAASQLSKGQLQFVSVGCFLPQVMFVAPVLNEYLHQISTSIYKEVIQYEDVVVGERTRPFEWMPHVTLGKELTKEQMQIAFAVLQNQFAPFKGAAVKIGLAKTNPYKDIETYVLK